MTKYQNYKHYKLPISMNPLDYGKLIFNKDNIYIIQVGDKTIAVISQFNEFNEIKFYRGGDLLFTYNDHKINDNEFIRSLENKKFTFKNGKLINVNNSMRPIKNPSNLNKLGIRNYSSQNIIKLRRVASKYIWKELVFNINNKVFSKILFENIFNKFWNTIESQFTDNNHMFILLKIKYINNEFSTIGKVQRINKSDQMWYLKFILGNMKFKSEYYNETQVESFIFSYGFKDGLAPFKEVTNKDSTFQNYKNHNLPITINPLEYGKLIFNKDNIYVMSINDKITAILTHFEDHNEVEFFKNEISLIKFKDDFISDNKFVRILDNKKFYFENGKQILFTNEIKSKFISKTSKTKNLVNNFITLDIETYIDNNVLIPYLISFYDGKNSYSFWLGDYINVEQMILDCLKAIFIRKYNGYKVYMHNMAKFDIIFLLKYLVKVATLQPVIHNGRIISLTLNYGPENKYKVEFKDSYLILLSSLSDLTKGFGVEIQKSIFPYLFVNENNLNYIGPVPDFEYFNKVLISDYNEYKSKFNNNWSLKNEAIKYCEIDCISLYQVIFKFSDLIFSYFKKNIHHYPTLPSLAFAIFRSNFMNDENIPQISGKIANDIRQGYTGGAVDMYIPKPPKGVKVKGYDVNALYPKQMFDRLMPIGNPTYFEGNIRAIDPNAFGFFYCNIIAPDNIKHPIIQTHVKINNMIRTIAPIGTWSDMIFSAEMDNAIKLGYSFEILWGYTFDNANIFKDYVEFLHSLRNEYPSGTPLNHIAKILLNSLYGRFGMDDQFANISVIHKDYLPDFENKFIDQIEEKIDLGEYVIVFYDNINQSGEEANYTHNISIPIAAAITAYSRIHMSQFKNNPKIRLFYTDTDSIYTDSELDDYFIDQKILGKLKLEYICEEAVFLGPKIYCLKTEKDLVIKVKGLKNTSKLNIQNFKDLLKRNHKIESSHDKWFRNLSEGKITIKEQLYSLIATENKRKFI